MVVKVKLRQSRQIYLELELFRNSRRELVVESVDSFHNQNVVLRQLHRVACIISLALGKVIRRDFHRLAVEQINKIVVQQPNIESLQALIIRLAVWSERIFCAPDIVVIKANDFRLIANRLQLQRQLFARRRLSRA